MSSKKRKREEEENLNTGSKCGWGDKENNDVWTPQELLAQIEHVFGKTHDPCPINGAAAAHVDPSQDGLLNEWGPVNYVNPPFNDIFSWFKKAMIEVKKGKTVLFLCPWRSNKKYWEHIMPEINDIWFFQGIKFQGYKTALPIPLALLIFKPNSEKLFNFQKTTFPYYATNKTN